MAKMKKAAMMRDESMSGFSPNSGHMSFPAIKRANQISGPNEWGLEGVDAEYDKNVMGLDKNKSMHRW